MADEKPWNMADQTSNYIMIQIGGQYSILRLDDDAEKARRIFSPERWTDYGRAAGYSFNKALGAAKE